MTTAMPTQPLTTFLFLFGEAQDSIDPLAHALDEHDVLGSIGGTLEKLSRPSGKAASNQLATAAHRLLDLDFGDLVVEGWRNYAELTVAAERTIATPDNTEIVELSTHCINSTYRPFIRLLVNDVHIATVHFELTIKFLVKGFVAVVRHGHLIALQSGTCEVTATLTAENRQLAKREAQVELPLILDLGDGVPLLQGPSNRR